jgi:hypothetical protein
MVKIAQDLESLFQNAVGLAAMHVDDETNAACIVFKSGVVESLLRG